ncbi:hypothetical protein CYH18_14500 [Listeria monocytogenes serotype 1/2a]|nr:hypothetical protein [Listeria monocytogenes serotype 1/2a]
METPISATLAVLLLSSGLGLTPPIQTADAQKVAEKLVPQTQIWRSELEHKQTQIDELESSLKKKDEELSRLKAAKINNTQDPENAPQTSQNTNEWQTGEFTAYYPANNALQGGTVTAKGDNLCDSLYYHGYQIVAAPPEIPFDTILEIEVDGQVIKAIVRDRGGAIKGNKFDIAMSNKANAYDFGRKNGRWRIVE